MLRPSTLGFATVSPIDVFDHALVESIWFKISVLLVENYAIRSKVRLFIICTDMMVYFSVNISNYLSKRDYGLANYSSDIVCNSDVFEWEEITWGKVR